MPIANNITLRTIRSATTLTEEYVAGTVLSSGEDFNLLGLEVTFADSLNTASLELKIEVSNDGGTNYFQQVSEATSSGTVTVSEAERTFATPGSYALQITPIRAKLVRVSVKATGTTTKALATVKGFLTNNEIGM